MIINTLLLPNATLALVEFLHDSSDEYVVSAYKGAGESGYTIINNKGISNQSASFAQSAGGDSLVVYPTERWTISKLSLEELDDISEYFGCDNLFNAAKAIIDIIA